MKLFKIECDSILHGIVYVVASSYDNAVAQCRYRILNISVIADTDGHSGYDVLVLGDKYDIK